MGKPPDPSNLLEVKLIELTLGYSAMVDDDDYERLTRKSWHARVAPHTVYAIRTIALPGKKYTGTAMHREVLNLSVNDGKIVDHIDGNGLNNQKSNLRIATFSGNSANKRKKRDTSSRFIGVYLYRNGETKSRAWGACIRKGKNIFLGYYEKEVDAARAYNEAAKRIHGEFAKLNHIPATAAPIQPARLHR